MKNTLKIVSVSLAMSLTVSFISFDKLIKDNQDEMKETAIQNKKWIRSELEKSEWAHFFTTYEWQNNVDLSNISKEAKKLIASYPCRPLEKVLTIGTNEREVIQDFKVGIKNCGRIVKNGIHRDHEDIIPEFKQMVSEYKEALRKIEFPNDQVLREDFEVIFYRYNHLINKVEDTELLPITYFILGDSAMRASSEDLFMVGPLLLSQLIFTIDDSPEVTQLAWIKLYENIHFGYTGSSGDHTPDSWDKLLRDMSYIVTKRSSHS